MTLQSLIHIGDYASVRPKALRYPPAWSTGQVLKKTKRWIHIEIGVCVHVNRHCLSCQPERKHRFCAICKHNGVIKKLAKNVKLITYDDFLYICKLEIINCRIIFNHMEEFKRGEDESYILNGGDTCLYCTNIV